MVQADIILMWQSECLYNVCMFSHNKHDYAGTVQNWLLILTIVWNDGRDDETVQKIVTNVSLFTLTQLFSINHFYQDVIKIALIAVIFWEY